MGGGWGEVWHVAHLVFGRRRFLHRLHGDCGAGACLCGRRLRLLRVALHHHCVSLCLRGDAGVVEDGACQCYVTAADVVHGIYNSRGLELAVAITGMIATMPYIALQLIGIGVVIKAMGLSGELPIVAAFIILALYTYNSGLRAPALIAFVKDIMIYIVVLVAVVVVPAKLGGYGAVFAAANEAFAAKGGDTGLILKPSQMMPYATLAFGSALAAFMYPHTLTGIFASKSADTIRKNAILLPPYTLRLRLIALLGYMASPANSNL